MNNNKEAFLLFAVFAYNLGEVSCWTNSAQLSYSPHCLSYFHHSVSHLSALFTAAECTIMTLFPLHFQSEGIRLNTTSFWFSAQNSASSVLTVSPTTKALIYSGESRSCLQTVHISAHCVYSANYAWRPGVPGAGVDPPRMNLFLRFVVEVQSVCLDHSFISLPIPGSHLYVTSDEQSCCSPSETLHASLAP